MQGVMLLMLNVVATSCVCSLLKKKESQFLLLGAERQTVKLASENPKIRISHQPRDGKNSFGWNLEVRALAGHAGVL